MKNITGIENSVLSQIAEANKKTVSVGAFEHGDTYDHEECFDHDLSDLAQNECKEADGESLSVTESDKNILYSHLARTKDISKNPVGASINQKV